MFLIASYEIAAIVLIIFFVIVFTISGLIAKKIKKVNHLVTIRKYDEALVCARSLTKIFRFGTGRENIRLLIAYISLALGKDDDFFDEIYSLKRGKSQMLKYYWLTFYYITKNDFISAKEQYEIFKSNEIIKLERLKGCRPYSYYDSVLTALFSYYEGSSDAQYQLMLIYDEISNPIIQDYVRELMD